MSPKQRQVSKVRITVLGAKSVGKTACINRLVYQRFFHDNQHGHVHHKTLTFDEDTYELDILEINKGTAVDTHCPKLDTTDAFIVVYSIDNRRSFDDASDWCIKLESRYPDLPVLLLANKNDVNYSREVDPEEGQEQCKDFFEVSAASEDSFPLLCAVHTLIKRVLQLRSSGVSRRKRSISSVLENLFTWNSRGSFSISV